MAVTYALATEMVYKAGAGASATATGAAYTLAFGLMAESVINSKTRFNWSDEYTAGLSDDTKYILVDAATNLGAIYIINYDMSGYSTLQEASTMCDILWANFNRDCQLLEDIKVRDFVTQAT